MLFNSQQESQQRGTVLLLPVDIMGAFLGNNMYGSSDRFIILAPLNRVMTSVTLN